MPPDPSRPPQTYEDCLRFLYARNQFAVKLGLDTVRALLERRGRPESGAVFIHVAGTNGKGSVCSNLAALLGACGYGPVGLYTSPHLVSFRERIRVDGDPVPKAWVLDWMRSAFAAILELQATYFECVTAMALEYFRFRDCRAAVLETGLGGRLDATNAVFPALTVISSVSLDHTAILGDTVEAIWGEKIGILKPGVPMVVSERRAHLLDTLSVKARAAASPVYSLKDYPCGVDGETFFFQGRFSGYALPASLRPEPHQAENLALSLLALETFLNGPPPAPGILIPALQASRVPGRSQLLEEPGMTSLFLDGAHNPEGMDALARTLRARFPGRRVLALFSVMRDKDYLSVYRTVSGFADQILFVSLESKFPRALPFSELWNALPPPERQGLSLFPAHVETLDTLLRSRPYAESAAGSAAAPAPFDVAVACGSLYLLGELIPMLLPLYSGLAGFRQFEGES